MKRQPAPAPRPRINPFAHRKESRAGKNDKRRIAYVSPGHAELPHVIKFSGGRSSGMLLFTLLKNGLMKPERGDVIVFNNTSAEHPATYEFVRECKEVCEKKYGIPFFWTEFQTYEDATTGGVYARFPTYRLVNDRPFSEDNPDGYHCRGEVFEEMISWRGYLPNRFSGRICTSLMKLFVSKEFLRDWFANKEGVERLGHFGETSRIDPDDEYASHVRNSGSTPKDVFQKKKKYCWSRPIHRPAKEYADFSSVADCTKVHNATLAGKSFGNRVRLSGDSSIDYCSFVGFRGDEPQRIARMRARQNGLQAHSDESSSSDNGIDSYIVTPEGEHVYAPLVQFGVSKEDVFSFWQKQKWDLHLPQDANMSNCVYCFLKGSNALWHIARDQKIINKGIPKKLRGVENTPADIEWWIKLEETYGRDLRAEKRKISNKSIADGNEEAVIGFFGMTQKESYKRIWASSERFKMDKSRNKKRSIYLREFDSLPCDCTD